MVLGTSVWSIAQCRKIEQTYSISRENCTHSLGKTLNARRQYFLISIRMLVVPASACGGGTCKCPYRAC